jgi:hypothetical protein
MPVQLLVAERLFDLLNPLDIFCWTAGRQSLEWQRQVGEHTHLVLDIWGSTYLLVNRLIHLNHHNNIK